MIWFQNQFEIKRQHLCHERMYQMMLTDELSKNNALWHYLFHFKADQEQKIAVLNESIAGDKGLIGPKGEDYDAAYLKEYFGDEAADNS